MALDRKRPPGDYIMSILAGVKTMRKAILLGLAGVFIASGAMACGWKSKTVSTTTQQTVMDDAKSGQSGGMTVKPDPKG
jgi:hypothetical protein